MKTKGIHFKINNLGGSVQHYYHFLLGFLAPLVSEIERDERYRSPFSKIFIRSCGPMDKHILALNYGNLEIINEHVSDEIASNKGLSLYGQLDHVSLMGKDDVDGLLYDTKELRRVGKIIKEKLSTEILLERRTINKNKCHVILIKRGGDNFYNSELSEIKTSGAQRRSIKNFDNLLVSLREYFPDLSLLVLEESSFVNQIAHFEAADLIIAQHGAALANLIFARPGTKVIEILPVGSPANCFMGLANCLELKHQAFYQESNHSDVDIESLMKLVKLSMRPDVSPPIFIHAWWRSSSTFLWMALRTGNAGLLCFNEPLNEQIAHLNVEGIDEDQDPHLLGALRHPNIGKNYFYEYKTALIGGNLQFREKLSYESYVLEKNDIDEELSRYILCLIDTAHSKNLRPVLCFTRSQLRISWLKAHFNGLHIGQIRNPIDQWHSFRVAPYFLEKICIISKFINIKFPNIFDGISGFTGLIADLDTLRLDGELERWIESNLATIWELFLFIWTMSTIQSLNESTYVIDVDKLTSDIGYNNEVTKWFEFNNCSVDLSSFKTPRHLDNSDPQISLEVVRKLARIAAMHCPSLLAIDEVNFSNNITKLSTLSRTIINSFLKNIERF